MYCPLGKMRFQSGADAKRWAKKIKKTKGGPRMIAYVCDYCEQWHVGHPPPGLARGEISRDEIRQGQRYHHRQG